MLHRHPAYAFRISLLALVATGQACSDSCEKTGAEIPSVEKRAATFESNDSSRAASVRMTSDAKAHASRNPSSVSKGPGTSGAKWKLSLTTGVTLEMRLLRELMAPSKDYKSWHDMSFDKKGRYLVAINWKWGVPVVTWDVLTWKIARQYRRFSKSKDAIAVGDNGLVLVGSAGRTLQESMHAFRLGKPGWFKKSLPSRLQRNPSTVKSICIAPENKYAVIAEEHQRVVVLDPPSLWTRRVVKTPACPATAVVCTADGKHVLVGCWTHDVRLFAVKKGFRLKEVRRTREPRAAVGPLALAKNSGKVVIGTREGSLFTWDYLTDAPPKRIRAMYPVNVQFGEVHALAVRPQGDVFVAGTLPDGLVVYDVNTGKKLAQIKKNPWKTPFSAAFSPDGKLLAVGYQDGVIRIWRVSKLPN